MNVVIAVSFSRRYFYGGRTHSQLDEQSSRSFVHSISDDSIACGQVEQVLTVGCWSPRRYVDILYSI